ncbi:AbgT family transporter [Conservatibacter flavescens]|uniref:p-aminobenzoyl-glutamate transporter n=1 Tax=Conservatibacter flavescens TaxID=28161 RepID=A0A2M8RZQ2_9PAST|nr:AbgT family transporter [Conservatibacter flavescens]PJG84381.1 p-aminobenzoyl-glutamate transporter [Conservatibacter flavescens]
MKTQPTTFSDRIEHIGNKIPHPFYLFIYLCIAIAIISSILNAFDTTILHPATKETVAIKSILSSEGLIYILNSTVNNFIGFKPLGLVLCMMIAIGLLQEVGLANAAIKALLLNAPKKLVTACIFFVGIIGNLASDAAFILVPPIAGIIFLATKRNPVVGVAAGFVAVAAGFTANIFIAGTDLLLSGITNEAIKSVSNVQISPAANWYFMLVSVPFLVVVCTLITEKIIEPRFPSGEHYANMQSNDKNLQEISADEYKALKVTGIVALLFIFGLCALIFPESSPLRNPKGGLVPSPFLSGIIPILVAFFLLCSIVFGVVAKKIKHPDDIPNLMANSLRSVGTYIVLVFVISQFIAWFNWTNLSTYLAVSGANFFSDMNLPPVFMLGALIVLSGIINLVVYSGSAQWAMMAPVFIPLFVLLGIEPEAIQMAYRIGDSTTNVISPTNAYIPMILAIIAQYDSKMKFGTFLSMMLPYALILLFGWGALFLIYYSFGLPIGPM